MSYSSRVPDAARRYFAERGVSGHPVITSIFWEEAQRERQPGSFAGPHMKGWRPAPWSRKIVSISALRKLRAGGASSVALSAGGRQADFTIAELLRVGQRPLLGGSIIGSRTWKAS
jgi:hypothetical protein